MTTARTGKIARFLDGVPRHRRDILTPEDVLLAIDHGERAVALLLDG